MSDDVLNNAEEVVETVEVEQELVENENILDFLEVERVSRLKHHVGITSNLIKNFLKRFNYLVIRQHL